MSFSQGLLHSVSNLFGQAQELEKHDYSADWLHPNGRTTQNLAPVQEDNDGSQLAGLYESSEREDLLDQHVAYFLKQHPEVHSKHGFRRIRAGVYSCEGREISVEWHYGEEEEGAQGYLLAVDGPLRQPFGEYMAGSETGVHYDDKRLGRSSLSQVPKGKRLSFGDANKAYSRLEAMKVAKEQALVREKAADFATAGMMVPQQELMAKYTKTISQKLGERRQRAPDPEPALPAMMDYHGTALAAPQAVPQALTRPPMEAPAPAAVPPPPPASVKAGKGKQQTHGAPKYCANHDKTEKRKKCKPQHLPCKQCKAVIQTNYVEFAICPTCSENDHRCMCCGSAAVGPAAPAPAAQAQREGPSSPMKARVSPQNAPASSFGGNLFGMPDLFGKQKAEAPSSGVFTAAPQAAVTSAWQGMKQPATTTIIQQGSALPAQNAMASQNIYTSQNAFTSYNPVASQNVIVGARQF